MTENIITKHNIVFTFEIKIDNTVSMYTTKNVILSGIVTLPIFPTSQTIG